MVKQNKSYCVLGFLLRGGGMQESSPSFPLVTPASNTAISLVYYSLLFSLLHKYRPPVFSVLPSAGHPKFVSFRPLGLHNQSFPGPWRAPDWTFCSVSGISSYVSTVKYLIGPNLISTLHDVFDQKNIANVYDSKCSKDENLFFS